MAPDSALPERQPWSRPRWQAWLAGLAALTLCAGLLALLAFGLVRSGTRLVIDVDGQQRQVLTHATTVGAALRQVSVELYPEDLLWLVDAQGLYPATLDTALPTERAIRVRRARSVALSADGQLRQIRTQATTVAQALRQAGMEVGPGDEIWLLKPDRAADPACQGLLILAEPCSQRVTPDEPLSQGASLQVASAGGGRYPAPEAAPSGPAGPVFIALRRATPVVLNYSGQSRTLYTTAETVAQVIREQGILLFLGDAIQPRLQTRLRPGMAISIQRSLPVQIEVDGRLIRTRTLAPTVAGVLGQAGVALLGRDTVAPSLDSPVRADMRIRVTRIREELEVEFETIPYATVWRSDPEMEIDTTRLVQTGQLGLTKRRLRIVYEDGREVSRVLEDAWTEQQPVTKTLSYGTKIVIRTLDTPHGPIEYWRKMRVYTVSYTAASSGKPKTHPRYGYTRLGWKATKGVVAVDPTVIPLRTRMYVPGYGFAAAGDTGGGVKGKLVDLCFDVGAYQSWHWWTDIYLLTPVPPRSQIRWLLPDWPKFPDRRR